MFEFIVNDYMIYDKMYGSPEKVLKVQENAIENYPENINYADMTGIEDIEEKERLLGYMEKSLEVFQTLFLKRRSIKRIH